MRRKSGLLVAALILSTLPFSKAEASGVTPEMLAQWQAMNKKLMQLQSEMLQMQKSMSAMTEQMLRAQGGSTLEQQSLAVGTDTTVRTAGVSSVPTTAVPPTNTGVTVRTAPTTDSKIISKPQGNYSSKDLENMGMGLESEAARTSISAIADEDKKAEEQKFRFNGEVRYAYARNRGGDNDRFNSNDSQIRVRLYGQQKLNDDWGLHGMLEGQKHFLDDSRTDLTSGSRIYVEGLTGITTVTAGKFGYLMADGNIYDSEFKGARASLNAAPWTYTAAVGRTGASADTVLGTATYTGDNYDLGAGIYKFGDDDWGRQGNSILMLGGNYYWDQVRLGAMWLSSDDDTDTTGRNGYVLSSRYRTMKSWKPGSWSLYANYYNQPWSTYRNHTMNGLGNTLHGFKGYGVGIDYAMAQEMVLNLEYYKLTDKQEKDSGSTLWGSLSFYFQVKCKGDCYGIIVEKNINSPNGCPSMYCRLFL